MTASSTGILTVEVVRTLGAQHLLAASGHFTGRLTLAIDYVRGVPRIASVHDRKSLFKIALDTGPQPVVASS